MSMNTANKGKDIFDNDFEVIYEGDLPDINIDTDDNYKDVLSSLSDLDTTKHIDYVEENYTTSFDETPEEYMKQKRGGKVSGNDSDKKRSSDKGGRKKGGFHLPNFLSPLKKGTATGGKIAAKATRKTLNLLLRAGTLVLIAIIFCMLGLTFWKNAPAYGNIAAAVAQKNYILGAYLGVALFLLLVEAVTFLIVLFGSSTYGKRGHRYDKGKGWFSFIFIYAGAYLSLYFGNLIPASPAPLQGLKGALQLYGGLASALLPLCALGVVSCLVRKYVIR